MAEALTQTDLLGALPLIARGKVRDLYEIDDKTLLFVATDRISAYDVIMENVCLPSTLAQNRLVMLISGIYRASPTRANFSPSAQNPGSKSSRTKSPDFSPTS